LDHYKKVLLQDWEELPQIFVTSSELKKGREEILQFISQTNKLME
jgi:GTP-binding protein